MTNEQYDEIETRARELSQNLAVCPTCETPFRKLADAVDGLPSPEDMHYGEYTYFGVTHKCNCEEQDELRRQYLLDNIPVKYWRYGEDDWYGSEAAWQEAQDYVKHWSGYKRQGLGIEFYSPGQGTGKTFLATWIARQLVKQGETVYYTRFLSLMGLHKREDQHKLERRLRYSTALVLDEVGYGTTEAQSDYFAREFEDLMRSRVDNALPTIMTTNMTPDELDKRYSRTYSVLAGAQMRHEVSYEDVRRKGKTLFLDRELVKRGEIRPIC